MTLSSRHSGSLVWNQSRYNTMSCTKSSFTSIHVKCTLACLQLKSTGFVVNLSNDTWSASINSAVLDQSMCKLANDMTTDFHRTDALPTAVSFSWICDNANKVKEIKVSATYSLRTKTAEFVSKVLNFTSTQKQDLAIASVAPFAGLGITAKTGTSPTLTVCLPCCYVRM